MNRQDRRIPGGESREKRSCSHNRNPVTIPAVIVFAIVASLSYILIKGRITRKRKKSKGVPKKVKNTGGGIKTMSAQGMAAVKSHDKRI